MKKMLLIFNHTLGQDQREDAILSLGVKEFVEMPDQLKEIWEQIPADSETIENLLIPIKGWLQKVARKGDVVLIQGDFGATWFMVSYAMAQEMVPIYSTTRRYAEEIPQKDGSLKSIHVFKHVLYRRYGR